MGGFSSGNCHILYFYLIGKTVFGAQSVHPWELRGRGVDVGLPCSKIGVIVENIKSHTGGQP